MNIMTYYIINNKIIARSYKRTDGFCFEIGTAFDERDPVSNLRRFFVTSSSMRLTKKELNQSVRKLEGKYFKPKLEIINEEYR